MHKFTASDGKASDRFGYAIASCGNMFVVGAIYRRYGREGFAYVFDMDSKTEMHKLIPTDRVADDFFGVGVAIFGNVTLVTASHLSAVYVFDSLSGEQLQMFTTTSQPKTTWWFGKGSSQLVIHASLNVGIVGQGRESRGGSMYNAGAIHVFDLSTGALIRKITPAVPVAYMLFGSSLAVSGDLLLVGASGASSSSGRVYVFDINANWTEIAFFGPSDDEIGGGFGNTLASFGPQFIVNAWNHGGGNGAVYVGNTTSKFIVHFFISSQMMKMDHD